MAISIDNTRTLLGLDQFARVFGINPTHFNQVTMGRSAVLNEDLNPAAICSMPIIQYSWQNADHVGREEIAMAIADAEAEIESHLGFRVGLTWEVNEAFTLPTPRNPSDIRFGGSGLKADWAPLGARWGYAVCGGTEAKTLVQADAGITYTDRDNDSYFETATVTVATTITDPLEVAVYYPVSLTGASEAGQDGYEIRPTNVVIAGGIATITFKRELAVIPADLSAYQVLAVDGYDNAQFLTTVDIYRHWTDPSQMVQWQWEPTPSIFPTDAGVTPTDVSAITTQQGCMVVRDNRLGVFAGQPATWDAVNQVYSSALWVVNRAPDRALLNYRAGWHNPRYPGQIDPKLARCIAYLAVSKLDRPLCECNSMESWSKYWSEDRSMVLQNQEGGVSRFQMTRMQGDCPLGPTRAGIYVWNIIKTMLLGDSATAYRSGAR